MKAKVSVSLKLVFEFVVEGRTEDEMRKIGRDLGYHLVHRQKLFHDRLDATALILDSSVNFGRSTLVSDDERTSTYTCEFCHAASFKDAWGPGRVTCPACKQEAFSVGEARA